MSTAPASTDKSLTAKGKPLAPARKTPSRADSRWTAAAAPAPRERAITHLIAVVDAARTAELERGLKAVGLSLVQHRALGWLRVRPGSSMTELSRGTFTERTTLTRAMDGLVERGLVERRMSKEDRRRVELVLTAEGDERAAQGEAVIAATDRLIAGAIPDDMQDHALRALMRLARRLIRDPAVLDTLTNGPQPGSAPAQRA
ncbi:MAG TPA: MarR family winged helix-turn-helix transcriptional regulator [Caulobacteraceae bacterium]|nr:MarR family winged helix-turn-helix transcriptional regulator [Caulobacteraceae bacterium]